jgi:hypothetical protein
LLNEIYGQKATATAIQVAPFVKARFHCPATGKVEMAGFRVKRFFYAGFAALFRIDYCQDLAAAPYLPGAVFVNPGCSTASPVFKLPPTTA